MTSKLDDLNTIIYAAQVQRGAAGDAAEHAQQVLNEARQAERIAIRRLEDAYRMLQQYYAEKHTGGK